MSSEDHKVSKISSDAIFAIKPIGPLSFIASFFFCFVVLFLDIRFHFIDAYRGQAQDFINPIFSIINLPKVALDKVILRYKDKTTLIAELEEKNQEIYLLNITNTQISEIQKVNEELGLLWQKALTGNKDYFLAKKIQISGTSFRPILVIEYDKGTPVNLDSAVISKHGVAGRISSIGRINAEVLLAQDPRSFIPVKTRITRNQAIVQGGGLDRKGALINIKKTASFTEGEEILTSGLAGVFPPGYSVGTISKITDSPDSEFLDIEIIFSSTPSTLDFFLVNQRINKGEIE